MVEFQASKSLLELNLEINEEPQNFRSKIFSRGFSTLREGGRKGKEERDLNERMNSRNLGDILATITFRVCLLIK